MDDLQGKPPTEVFQIDEAIQAAILNIDEKDKRIGLSIKALRKPVEKDRTEPTVEKEGAFSTLGDILEPAMKKNSADDAT